jgi:hypothetical protein
MNIELALTAEDLNEETLQGLTRELCTTINQQTNVRASLGEQKSGVGTKGDPITIGSIVLAVLGTGGGAVALINVFKSYVDRSKELCIKLKKPSGEEIELSSKNIDGDEIKSMLNDFLAKG